MTEIKAPYTFVLAEPPQEPSLAELRQIRREYLRQGAENFEALALVVNVFGSPAEIHGRQFRVWQRGRVTALYHVEGERYLASEKRYEETEVLSIFLDLEDLRGLENPELVQVCYLRCGDAVVQEEQKFIPGQWLQDMLAEYDAANRVQEQQRDLIRERERQALIRELMIGKEI